MQKQTRVPTNPGSWPEAERQAIHQADRADNEKRSPFYIWCKKCGHEWIAFYFPLVLDEKGMNLLKMVSKFPCPMCAEKLVMVGKAPIKQEKSCAS